MKVIVLMSGGLDSTVLLHHVLRTYHDADAIGFNYGQRHVKELLAAEAICSRLDVRFDRIDLPRLGGCALTDRLARLPMDARPDDPVQSGTVVPNRNMIMMSVAVGIAVSRGAGAIAIGAHRDDHAIYPDCREEFLDRFDRAAWSANGRHIYVLAPFVRSSKCDIVRLGREFGVDFNATWTCYAGGDEPCGRCGSCIERREALEAA